MWTMLKGHKKCLLCPLETIWPLWNPLSKRDIQSNIVREKVWAQRCIYRISIALWLSFVCRCPEKQAVALKFAEWRKQTQICLWPLTLSAELILVQFPESSIRWLALRGFRCVPMSQSTMMKIASCWDYYAALFIQDSLRTALRVKEREQSMYVQIHSSSF